MPRTALLLCLAALGLSAAALQEGSTPPAQEVTPMRKLTPVLVVDSLAPSVRFWTERLGFETTAEVPHEGEPGFAMLKKDGVEIMYQSRASVVADLASMAQEPPHRTVLFVEVEDLAAVERAMEGVELLSPRRVTFYGMAEIAVREPGGNVVVFAQPVETPAGAE